MSIVTGDMELIKQGAEAILYRDGGKLVKERIPKGYRIPEIDLRLRKLRTRGEGRLLQRAPHTPKVFLVDENTCKIEMEFIDGQIVRDVFDGLSDKERQQLCLQMGKQIAELHDLDIIHGDLTTSNMLMRDGLFFIDFGLGFMSKRVEDKAVDLHLLKQAMESKHYLHAEQAFSWVLGGYGACRDAGRVLQQLEKVEGRGRYKGKK